jgi:hypothetical protein
VAVDITVDSHPVAAAHMDPASRVTEGSPVMRPVVTPQDASDDIPLPARRAYLRAALIMADVAPRCRIPWTLVAAVGRVESDHGRHGDSELDSQGVARPHVFGATLDGRGARAKVPDTDDGDLDRDKRWDRAVGPLQFIPSTWAVVGVDGDGDGTRSPHDIDDAALAASVYLCADSTDLTRPAHVRQALLRYNPSQHYVTLVRAYERSYRTDELAAVRPLATLVTPAAPSAADAPHLASVKRLVTKVDARPAQRAAAERPESSPLRPETKPDARPTAKPASRPGAAPSTRTGGGPTPTPTTAGPTTGATKPTTEPTSEPTSEPTAEPTPTTKPTTEPTPTTGPTTGPTAEPTSEPTSEPTPTTVTETGLWAQCGTGYCLGDSTLDLSGMDPAEPAAGDYDGDGVIRDNAAELLGLEGSTVEVTARPQPTGLVPLAINGTPVQAP